DVILKKLEPRRFDAFDIFRLHEAKIATARPTSEMFGGKTHLEFYRQRYATYIDNGTVRILVGDSSTLMAQQEDASYGIIYIDGDHSYESVRKDAEIPKLRSDGILIFNDYVMNDCFDNEPYGIVPVVNSLCVNRGWRVLYFAFQSHMFCDI